MTKNVLIVGAPRSGTSLASSILAGVGYHVGHIRSRRERLGDDHNPFGYFEADDIVEANARLLERGGHPFHNTWTSGAITEAAMAEIRGLVVREEDRRLLARYEQEAPWLWKDPRLCFTLPYWWKLLDPSSTVVWLTTRDTSHAHPSFIRKGWAEAGGAEKRRVTRIVRQHAKAAREAIDSLDIPHVTVDYADYAKDPSGVADRLSRAFGVRITPDDLNYRPELDHSSLRGRLTSLLRSRLKRLPREPVERVAELVPRSIMGLLFPERNHARWTSCSTRRRDEARDASNPAGAPLHRRESG